REMAQGKTNAGIEQALFLSESTVERHFNAIFTKLGISAAPVHRRVVAVLAFLQNAAPDSVDGTRTCPKYNTNNACSVQTALSLAQGPSTGGPARRRRPSWGKGY